MSDIKEVKIFVLIDSPEIVSEVVVDILEAVVENILVVGLSR